MHRLKTAPAVLRGALAFLAALALLGQGPQREHREQTAEPPTQPIPFSHKTHVASAHLKCQECHPAPDPGERMTLPAVSTCMACHISIAKDRPAIRALSEYAKNKQPIKWVRVYSVPSDVFWSHRPHLAAGMTCEMCHGQVPQMDATARVTNVTTMGGCVDCHKQHQANTGCNFCHEGK
jgi:hypothetical protein